MKKKIRARVRPKTDGRKAPRTRKPEYRELEYGERIKAGDLIGGSFEVPKEAGLVGKKYHTRTPWKIFRRVMSSAEVQAAMDKVAREAPSAKIPKPARRGRARPG